MCSREVSVVISVHCPTNFRALHPKYVPLIADMLVELMSGLIEELLWGSVVVMLKHTRSTQVLISSTVAVNPRQHIHTL